MSLVQNISQRIPQFHKNVSKTSAKSLNTRIQGAFDSNNGNMMIVLRELAIKSKEFVFDYFG